MTLTADERGDPEAVIRKRSGSARRWRGGCAACCCGPMVPLTPGRAESHGVEYKRNGTLSLFAALNTATGEVLGMTAPRHTSEQFVGFLGDVLASQPEGREIHVICDNVSSHKTELVQAFLVKHSNVQIHYTPTYSSWLN